MAHEGQEWFEDLIQAISEYRTKRPIPSRDDISELEERQCRIIGGSFISWLENDGPQLILERKALSKIRPWGEDPFIVFTSSVPGLAAAREILGTESETIAYLFTEEFEEWLATWPDADNQWHIHTWSYFTPVDKESDDRFLEHPVSDDESLWLHTLGTRCGELFERGCNHLWKWDGTELLLLQAKVDEWVS